MVADVDEIRIGELQVVHRDVAEDNQLRTFGLDEDARMARRVADPHNGSGFRPPNPSSTRCQ